MEDLIGSIKENPKKVKRIGIAVVVAILAIVGYNVMFGYNSATQLLVKQSPNGSLSCIDHAGFYFKGPFTDISPNERFSKLSIKSPIVPKALTRKPKPKATNIPAFLIAMASNQPN